MKILLCSPRGFCAGVVRAIECVKKALNKWGAPIYIKHEIVHNSYVINSLKEKGAIFVEDIYEIPKNSKVIYSAHGVFPEDRKIAKELNLLEIDATCPLVEQNHNLVLKFAKKGYKIILIGHKKHVEVMATAKEAENSTFIIESVLDVENLKFSKEENIFYLTQTTLSQDLVKDIVDKIKEKYPHSKTIGKSSICYATFNRQNSFKSILNKIDLGLVIGDIKSSNSNRLKEIGEKESLKTYLINSSEEIKKEWFLNINTIGITAGASTPEKIVKDCIDKIKQYKDSEVIDVVYTKEKMKFPLPKEIL